MPIGRFADLSNMAAEEPVGGDRVVSAMAKIQKGASKPKMFCRLKVEAKGVQAPGLLRVRFAWLICIFVRI